MSADKAKRTPVIAGAEQADAGFLIAVRVCLLALALLTTSVFALSHGHELWISYRFLYLPIALLFGFCAASGIWILWRPTGLLFIYLQFFADMLMVTGIVYVSGGPISPFLFLYLALVAGAAVLSNGRTALVIGGASLAAYLLLVWALVQGLIPPPGVSEVVELPGRGILVQVLGLALAMGLVGVAGSYVRGAVRAYLRLAEQSTRRFEELSERQRVLVEGIPDGVITTDLQDKILSVNQAALDLLQRERKQVEGADFKGLIGELFPGLPSGINFKDPQRHELELKRKGTGEVLQLIYSTKPIIDQNNELTGTLYIFQDVTKLRSIEDQLALQERMAKMLAEKSEPVDLAHPNLPDFVGESPVMRKVFQLISRVAPSEANVLVTGESGTGKELVARAIHLSGPRSKMPFVAVNCGAVPESLIESELFGHKKGSFTGATADHAGLFEQAEGGTIFLDEIGELPLQMQAKLLRAIQEKTVRPVGSEREIPIDVRIISATNRNLKKEVESGNYREDLYYRLNVIAISLPPLRDRKEDLPLLVNSILKRLVDDSEVVPVVPPATMKLLMDYNYRGNVRELENILERALVLGGEIILPEHLPESVRETKLEEEREKRPETKILINESIELPVDLDNFLAGIERTYLETALAQSAGVKKDAASLLGMNFRSFRYRLQKFDIEGE